MIKINNKNAIANNKIGYTAVQFIVVTSALIVSYSLHSANCRVATNMCEVENAIAAALTNFAPTPPAPTFAGVSIIATSVTSIVPSAGPGPVTYNYNLTNTLRAVGSRFINGFTISCTPNPLYQIYSGGTAPSESSAIAATFDTTTPGACPPGTASCGTPAVVTLNMTTASTIVEAIDPNYNITYTSTNVGWNAYVTGYYVCTYTDPNLATPMTMLVPWDQGS